MRISTDRSDPGYFDGASTKVRVFLNGVQEMRAITADDEAGEIVRVLEDERGAPRLDAEARNVLTETVRGSVRIEMPEWLRQVIEEVRSGAATLG